MKPKPIPAWECGTLPFDEWVSEYQPCTDMLETYGEDYAWVMKAYDRDPNVVWTLIDGENGPVIVSGWHYVNRLGYYITAVSVPDMVSIEVEDN